MRFFVLMIATLLLVACGNLNSNPGPPLVARWSDSSELTLVQAIEPVRLEFSVEGCDDFTATANVNAVGAETGKSTVLTVEPTEGGAWQATVPVEGLRPPMNCEAPQPAAEMTLHVTCAADRRGAQSSARRTNWRSSARYTPFSARPLSPVTALFPSAFEGSWYAFAAERSFTENGSTRGWFDVFPPKRGFRLANGLLLVAEEKSKQDLPLPNGGSAEWTGVHAKALLGSSMLPVHLWVPLSPSYHYDVFSFGGELLLVSQSSAARGPEILVSRLDFDQPYGREATIKASQPTEDTLLGVSVDAPVPRIFMASSSALRILDLQLNVLREVPLLQDPYSNFPFVRPFVIRSDGQAWAYARNSRLWFQSEESEPTSVGDSFLFIDGETELAFLRSGGLVARGLFGEVMLFSRPAQSPGVEVSLAVPGQPKPLVKEIIALESGPFAVVTSTGVQLFDETGHRLGGADPLPEECAQVLTEDLVTPLGPSTLGVAGKSGVFSFDVN